MLIHALYNFLLVPKREIEARLVTILCLFAFRCPGTLGDGKQPPSESDDNL
jgi:hypothetical protein